MALRSLATRMRIPPPPALRRRPAAARSRFLGTTPGKAEQRANGSANADRPLESLDGESLSEELYKIGEVLSQRNEELEKVCGEIKRIAKWYACTIVGVPLLAWSVDCLSRFY